VSEIDSAYGTSSEIKFPLLNSAKPNGIRPMMLYIRA
jgi:hypothetical protein